MALIIEDSQETLKKRITIPKKAKEVFKSMARVFEPYLSKDKGIEGRNVLKSYASDETFNKKGSNPNGKKEGTTTVSVTDAKVRLSRQNRLNPKSIEYQLYGGQLAHDILKRGVEAARSVSSVPQVKPPKPTAVEKPKTDDVKTKEINVVNGKITFNESVNNGYHIYYDYITDYGADYILSEFTSNMNGHYSWAPLINPSMYKKALDEFMKYGALNVFPEKYIYQWFGIIMKNTAILRATTMLAGHDNYYDIQVAIDFMNNLLGEENVDYDYAYENEGDLKIRLSEYQLTQLLDGNEGAMFKEGTPLNIDPNEMVMKFKRQVDEFNTKSAYMGKLSIENDGIWWFTNITDLLDIMGFFEWCNLPDGSDPYSDFGLAPLEKIIIEYRDGMGAAQVLVLINKALDVAHCRGDLSSIFIEGGRKTLSRISESKKLKKVIINEGQIPLLIKK